jgi:hypothetical protein
MSTPSALVQKLWNYCDIPRDEGLSCGVPKVERRLSVVEELEAVVSANLQRASGLRQSILYKAFTGSSYDSSLSRFIRFGYGPPGPPPPVHFAKSIFRSASGAEGWTAFV